MRADGLAGLLDQRRRGRASSVPQVVERVVVTVRLLTYWDSRRLAAEFTRRDFWPLSQRCWIQVLLPDIWYRPG